MMKYLVRIVLIIGTGSACSSEFALANDNPTVEDLARIKGVWEIVSEVRNGAKPEGSASRIGWLMVFTEDRTTLCRDMSEVRRSDEIEREGAHFSIDATKRPKQLDYSWTVKDIKVEIRAIYSLKGNKLRICSVYGNSIEPPPTRPTAFASPEGSHITLRVLARRKSENGGGVD